ncbi:MAG TPA: sugar transferase [Bryobacteraceae bacterium]|nr:sugar transferase [Bryobacteraceae bacterium]
MLRIVETTAEATEVSERKRICVVVSSIATVEAFLLGHLASMSRVYDVCVVANCRDKDRLRRQGLEIDVLYAPVFRNISLLRDLLCLFVLFRTLSRHKFDAVHSVTPKAGLLAMLAATLSRTPVRIHTFTGQVWKTRTGASRQFLKTLDRILASCATHVLADSHSQMQFLLDQKVISPQKASVLADGSISGVDLTRFCPRPQRRVQARSELGIPLEATVLVYIGRLKRDKGILDLASAFSQVCRTEKNVYLTLVGTDEEGLQPRINQLCTSCRDKLRFVDWTEVPELYMAGADLLCLPSYREGFNNVILESAACEVPSLASRIPGVVDGVIDEVTGILHEPGDIEALIGGMHRAIRNPSWRVALGKRARLHVQQVFSSQIVISALLRYYRDIFSGQRTAPATRKFLDLVLAFVVSLLLSPIFALVAIAVLVCLGRPVLFRQTRIGWCQRTFTFYKFRTMTDARDGRGALLPDAQRLTRLGRFLRRLSLDELPQLWNVFKGDMSLVGPRPLLPEYLPRYTATQRRRHDVRPGITGWAQVHGRNRISWEKKFEYDVWYVDHRNLWLDLKILGLTIRQVLQRDGINQDGHATTQEFRGSEETLVK